MRSVYARLQVAIVLICALCPVIGCGGGGGGVVPPPPPQPPPPPPPPIEIGDGPGPMADAVAPEPGVSTLAARNAPPAGAPSADAVRVAALSRLEALATDPPSTQAELAALLADFTGWVTQQPDDAAAQAGLAVVMVFAGAYNAGIAAGYAPGDLLEIFRPITDLAPAAAGESHVEQAISAPFRPLLAPLSRDREMRPAQWLDPTAPDFSSADLQIAIRSLWLPVINEAIARLEAVADHAGGSNVPLVQIGGRRPVAAYRAEVRALIGMMRVLKGGLLTACAWQLNPGEWDWTQDLPARDADGNGVLTVDEYCPPDPFLWRHQSATMRAGGNAIRSGLDEVIAALGERRPDSFLQRWAAGGGSIQMLRDARAVMAGTVDVTIGYGNTGPARTRTVPMNLARAWDRPVDDAKELLPWLRPVDNPAWQALPRTIDDFPDPTLGGVFPQPQPVISILAAGPRYVEITHGELTVVLVDRR